LAFYTGLLGMRLVKKTVNQDDVSAWYRFLGQSIHVVPGEPTGRANARPMTGSARAGTHMWTAPAQRTARSLFGQAHQSPSLRTPLVILWLAQGI
jgi:catechol 2,3-dioxygenase-like lactoylglutathione lyase family enzyme